MLEGLGESCEMRARKVRWFGKVFLSFRGRGKKVGM